MRTIKVFLASSDELTYERLQFDSLFNHLNRIFRPRGLYLELSMWEYLDSSMGIKRKQDEYNEELKTCEMCIVMFWTRFGEYTNEELMTAYKELKEGRNPKKLYVFFKEPAEMSDDLKVFKQNFSKELGHFFCKFENVDSMRLHFLLQLEAYNAAELKNLVKVERSKVVVDGNEIVNLDNIPFASKNKEYRRLKDRIAKTESEISAFEGILAVGSNDVISGLLGQKRTELYYLKEELSNHENLLFDTALRIVRQQGRRISDRMARAIEAFDDGRVSDANTILDEALHDARTLRNDIHKTKEILHQQQEGAAVSISELLLKASVVLTDELIAINDRINTAEEHYEEAYFLAKECNYNRESYVELLEQYTDFLMTYAKYDRCLLLSEELLKIKTSFMNENTREIATVYQEIGLVYYELGEYKKALQYFEKAHKILLEILAEENHLDLASCYNCLGSVYYALGEYKNALQYHEDALKITLDIQGEKNKEVALYYSNIGVIYEFLLDLKTALKYHEKALNIGMSVLGATDPDLASIYHNIGRSYKEQGEYNKALEFYNKAQKIELEALGENHPKFCATYNNIGVVYKCMGKFRKALEYYEKSLKLGLDLLGEKHPEIVPMYNNIGLLYKSLREYKRALHYMEKARKLGLEVLGESHPLFVTIYHYMGEIYQSLGDINKSMKFFNKAQKIRVNI